MRKITFLALLLAIFLVAIAACAQPASTPAPTAPPATTAKPAATGPKTGGVLHVSHFADGVRMGWPGTVLTFQDIIMGKTSVEFLMRVDPQGNTTPWLAESWQTDAAAKTITLKLRKGVKFSDGTDFNAEAVKWNFQMYTASGRSELAKITSIDIVDDYTVRCNLSEWDNTIFMGMVWQAGWMISPTAWKNAPGATTDKERSGWAENNPVGTGPFTLVSWAKGSKQVYKKNPNYWGKGMPYLDGVEWNIIADSMTQTAAFQAKEVDIIFGVSPSVAKTLKGAGFNITELKSGLGAQSKGIIANSASATSPFKDVKLRQVLSYAIDTRALIDGVYGGFASPMIQYMPGGPWTNPDVKGYPFNLAKAQEIMAAAGYSASNPLKTTLVTENTPDDVNTCTAIQAMLAKAYIQAQVSPSERGLIMQFQSAGTWDGLMYSTLRMDPEPSLQFVRIFSNKAVNYGKGLQHFDDLEAAIADMTKAPTDDARKKLVYGIQQMIIDKYCLFNPYFVISPLAVKQPYCMDDNFDTVKMDQWTPESAWLNK